MLEWLDRLFHPLDCSAAPDTGDPKILVCSFRGTLGDGSSGNGQVDRMERTINEALANVKFRGLILDLTAVRYTFGNHIWDLMMNLRSRRLSLAVVVSPACEQLGDFAARVGGWSVCRSLTEAIASMRGQAGGDA